MAQGHCQSAGPMPHTPSGPLTIARAERLCGRVRVPGDKSISHRALMLSALAVGESRIEGLLEGEDVLATAAALGIARSRAAWSRAAEGAFLAPLVLPGIA